jgi:hypothetical protein
MFISTKPLYMYNSKQIAGTFDVRIIAEAMCSFDMSLLSV